MFLFTENMGFYHACVSAGEFGLQPEPSLVLSQLVQRHTGPSLPLARQPSPPSQQQQQAPPTSVSPAPQHSSTPAQAGPVMAVGAKPPAPTAGLDPQGGSTPQQQRAQLKGQKRRIPPTSKVKDGYKTCLYRFTTLLCLLKIKAHISAQIQIQGVKLISRSYNPDFVLSLASDPLHSGRDAGFS